jgi:hypothetical protein
VDAALQQWKITLLVCYIGQDSAGPNPAFAAASWGCCTLPGAAARFLGLLHMEIVQVGGLAECWLIVCAVLLECGGGPGFSATESGCLRLPGLGMLGGMGVVRMQHNIA